MAISPDILEKLYTPEEDLQLDLSWLRPDDARKVERVLPGRRGLTFDEIEAGREGPQHAEAPPLLPRDPPPGQWLPKTTPAHYETKLFLLSQIMDEARHLDVFRKRALVNGGGLLSEGQSGPSLRVILDAKDFPEMSAIMHVFAEGFIQSLFRTGEYVSFNEAEKRIYRLCYQDESRHLGFGVMHLKYILETEPWRRGEIQHYLNPVVGDLIPAP